MQGCPKQNITFVNGDSMISKVKAMKKQLKAGFGERWVMHWVLRVGWDAVQSERQIFGNFGRRCDAGDSERQFVGNFGRSCDAVGSEI